MNYLATIVVPIIFLYGTSYGVRMTALRDMLLTTKFVEKPEQKVPKEFLENDENIEYTKQYRATKFDRSQKLCKYAKDRQNRDNKRKKLAAWKPHSQKRKKQLLHYMMSHQ